MADLSGATQQDLGQLLASMRKICDEIQSSTKRFGSPSHFRSSLRRRRSETAGANPAGPSEPITFVDSLDQARRILEQRGIITVPTTTSQADPPQPAPAEPALPDDSPSAALEVARPVLELGHENALAHLAAFRDHLFPLYPCIDLALAKNNIDSLFRTSLLSFADGVQDLGVDLIDIEATKAVMAIGMLIKGNADSPLSSSLETHLIWNSDNIIRRDQAQIEDVIMGALLVSAPLQIVTVCTDAGLISINVRRPYISCCDRRSERLGEWLASWSSPLSRSGFIKRDITGKVMPQAIARAFSRG